MTYLIYKIYVKEILSIASMSYIYIFIIKSYTQGTIEPYSCTVNTNGRIQISIYILV